MGEKESSTDAVPPGATAPLKRRRERQSFWSHCIVEVLTSDLSSFRASNWLVTYLTWTWVADSSPAPSRVKTPPFRGTGRGLVKEMKAVSGSHTTAFPGTWRERRQVFAWLDYMRLLIAVKDSSSKSPRFGVAPPKVQGPGWVWLQVLMISDLSSILIQPPFWKIIIIIIIIISQSISATEGFELALLLCCIVMWCINSHPFSYASGLIRLTFTSLWTVVEAHTTPGWRKHLASWK